MDRAAFLDQLLQVMEAKSHWAWPLFTTGKVDRQTLHIHFEQEYAIYVRDFPWMIGRAHAQCPIAEVRRELAENLYEEETGGLVAGRPHPDLFLEYPRGLGMDLGRFEQITLLPKAAVYRTLLDQLTQNQGWEIAAAVTTLFLEGTRYERGEIDSNAEKRPQTPLEQHPLVLHYGLPLESLALTKAHRQVEGEHRQAAWHCILDYVHEDHRAKVIDAMQRIRAAWSDYRDDVATACGLTPSPN